VAAIDPNQERKVIPRWHSLAASAKQGEIGATHDGGQVVLPFSEEEREESLSEHREHWSQTGTLAFAEDFVAAALVLGEPEAAREAAEVVLANPGSSPLAKTVAQRILTPDAAVTDLDDFDPFDVFASRQQVARLKGRLREDPRAALTWAEISRAYAALGQSEKAVAAMDVALSLAPNDRFLLRSAARLGLHIGEPDRAHRLLTSSDGLRSDPWLLSAEIAIAPLANRQSRNHRHARQVLESGRFFPHSTSELASALGTEALTAGDRRGLRKLLGESLVAPTENAVAQAEWVSRQEQSFEFDSNLLGVEDSYEARAHYLARERQDEESLTNAWAWLRDQPFASEPAVFGSYRGALVRDYETAIRFARAGLRANPTDYMLRNNLIFALASSGRVEEAREELDLLDEHSSTQKIEGDWGLTVDATRGLMAFREGSPEVGRKAYLQVIGEATDPSLKALAAILWAREEAHADTAEAEHAAGLARRLVAAVQGMQGPRVDDVPAWLEHLKPAEVAS